MLAVLLICVAIYGKHSILSRRSWSVLGIAGGVVGLAICVHGARSVGTQIDTLTSGSLESLDQKEARRRIWAANLAAARHYPFTGTGVGSHGEVYPVYFSQPSDVEYTHAENGYLQVLSEAGTAGLVLLLGGIALCVHWCAGGLLRSTSARTTASLGAVTAGLAASLVHSICDFVWYIPACMSVAIMLAACACRLHQLTRARGPTSGSSVPVARPLWCAVAAVTPVLAAAMIQNWVGPGLAAIHWDRYLTASLSCHEFSLLPDQDRDDHGREATAIDAAWSMKRDLEQVLRYDPCDARAHLRLAGVHLRLFDYGQRHSDNAMGLSEIRDAAVASRFPSRRALVEWLNVAIGQQRQHLDQALLHARRAVQLCPLQGEGYVYLAELAFLEGQDQQAQRAYVGQALQVRPYHGAILFAAGREAMLTGQVALALDLWQRAFQRDRELQNGIVTVLAPQLPASFLIQHLQPNLDAMRLICTQYEAAGRPDQARLAEQAYVARLEQEAGRQSGPASAQLWRQAYIVHGTLGDPQRALACVRKSVDQAPHDFTLRHRLATALCAQQQYDEAYEHLLWCAQRKPHDALVQRQLREASAQNDQ